MEFSITERLAGTITGIHGTHVFLKCKDQTFYANREQLDFNDLHIGLPVSFVPGERQSPVSLPHALTVRKA